MADLALAAGFTGAAQYSGWQARQTAASILTSGNAGRLPGPSGFPTRADYASALKGQGSLASRLGFSDPAKMVSNHPFSSNAASTKALQAGAAKATAVSPPKALGGVLAAVDPLVHGIAEGRASSGDGYDKFFAGLTGAVKRADNVVVSWGAGVAAAAGMTVLSGGTAVAAAPVAGVAAGTGVGMMYEGWVLDVAWNGFIERTLGQAEPYLASGSRYVGSGIGRAADWAISVGSSAFSR
jgi:hypothetical protein